MYYSLTYVHTYICMYDLAIKDSGYMVLLVDYGTAGLCLNNCVVCVFYVLLSQSFLLTVS